MKNKERIIGIILTLIGLFMLFKAARVHSFGFFRFYGVSTSGIILVLMIISGVFLVAKPSKLSKIFMITSVCMLVLSLILGTNISFYYVSLLDIILILVPLAIGLGLIVKSYITKNK